MVAAPRRCTRCWPIATLVARADDQNQYFEVELAPGANAQELLRRVVATGSPLRRFELIQPSLQQIFLDRVGARALRQGSPAMDKLIAVFEREYLERVRSKWFLIGTFLGPVFMGIILVVPTVLALRTKTSAKLADVVILDATGTGLGARVSKSLGASSPVGGAQAMLYSITTSQLDSATTSATTRVMKNQSQGYILLDSNTLSGTSMQYAGRNASSIGDVQTISGIVRQSLLNQRLEGEGIDPGRVASLTAFKLDTKTEKITDKGREGEGDDQLVLWLHHRLFALLHDHDLRADDHARGDGGEDDARGRGGDFEHQAAGAAGGEDSGGRIGGAHAGALVGGDVVHHVSGTRGDPGKFGRAGGRVVVAEAGGDRAPGAGSHCCCSSFSDSSSTSLFAAVGSMVSSGEDIQQAAMPVIMLLVSALIFIQPILFNPGSTLAKVMSWLPFSAPILMPLRMSLISISWYELTATLAGLALACLAASWVSARIYRVGLLMYGKRPSYAELAKWVRAG